MQLKARDVRNIVRQIDDLAIHRDLFLILGFEFNGGKQLSIGLTRCIGDEHHRSRRLTQQHPICGR